MIVIVSAQPMGGAAAAAGVVLAFAVVGALIAKESVTAVPEDRGVAFGRVLDVALAPLLLVFGILIALQLIG